MYTEGDPAPVSGSQILQPEVFYQSVREDSVMATIKDVAALAGVSTSTVSIIINGKAKERSIPEATETRVREAMNELGYRTNQAARRLRSQEKPRPVVAFFWPLDFRINILASFLNTFQREIERIGWDCELVVQPYDNNHLDRFDSLLMSGEYSGAIIGACTKEDLAHLEKIPSGIPVILINRSSEVFSTVGADNDMTGVMAAGTFAQAGIKELAVFASGHSYLATGLRLQSFLRACDDLGLSVPDHFRYTSPSTIQGGYETGLKYISAENRPNAVFCDSELIALGALSAFSGAGIHVPEDVMILTIAMMEPEYTAHSIPPLSVVEMPNQEIGKSVINLMRQQITIPSSKPAHLTLNASLILRESFRV